MSGLAGTGDLTWKQVVPSIIIRLSEKSIGVYVISYVLTAPG